MKTPTAINYFGGTRKLAAALGITHPAVCQWGEYPPAGQQAEIELLTAGILKREPKKSSVPPCIHHHPETKVS